MKTKFLLATALLTLISSLLILNSHAAVPLFWTVETTRATPATFEAYQGETLTFEAALTCRGKPLEAPLNYSFFWQTNGMGNAYWEAPCSRGGDIPVAASTNVLFATWLPAYDVGARVYNCFIGSPSNIYHAAFQLRLRPSPGASPNTLPLPTPVIDFAKVRVLNPPWGGSARQLPKYLHLLDFDDSYPADAAWYYSQPQDYGSCSAVRDGNTLSRNYDWKFDEAAEFIVRMSAGPGRFASVGVANCGTNLTEQFVTSGRPSRYFKCLPGHTVDGINEHGVVVEINVVDGVPAWHTTGDIHPLAAVRWALDHATNAQHAATELAARIAFPAGWAQNFHYMIADERETYIVENGTAYQGGSGVSPLVMTNFRLYPTRDTTGAGQERYNLLAEGANITNAWYTRIYSRSTNPPWLSEFGNNYEHWNVALNAWERLGTMEARRATGAFWQTVHTSIYDISKRVFHVSAQENDDWYVFQVPVSAPKIDAYTKAETDAKITEVNILASNAADDALYARNQSQFARMEAQAAQESADRAQLTASSKADKSEIDQIRTEFAGRMRFLVSEKTTTDHDWDTGSGWGEKDPLYTAVTGEGRGAYAAIAPSLNGSIELVFTSEYYEEDPIRDSYSSYYGSMYWRTNLLDSCSPDITVVRGYQSASVSSPYTGYTHIEASFTLPSQTYYYDYGGGDVTRYEAYRIPLHFTCMNDLVIGQFTVLDAWCDSGVTMYVEAFSPVTGENCYYTCFGFFAYVVSDTDVMVSYNWERYDYYSGETTTGYSYFYVNISNPNQSQTRMACFGDRGAFATASSVNGMVASYIQNNDIAKAVLKMRTGKDGELGDGPGYMLYNWNSDMRSWRLAVPRLDVTLQYTPAVAKTNITAHSSSGVDRMYNPNLPINVFVDRFPAGSVLSRVVQTHGQQGTDGCREADVKYRAYDVQGGEADWSAKILNATVTGLTYGTNAFAVTYSSNYPLTNLVLEADFRISDGSRESIGHYRAHDFTISQDYGLTYVNDVTWTNRLPSGSDYLYNTTRFTPTLGFKYTRYPTQMKAIDTPVVRMATVDTSHYYWDENLRCTMQLRLRNGCLVLEKVSDKNLTLDDVE